MNDVLDLLVVDMPNVYARSNFKLKELARSDGKPSGALYGTIRSVLALEKKWQPRRVACAFEGGMHWRRDVVPQYKADRDGREPIFDDEQMVDLEMWCWASGYDSLKCEGYEADDLIGSLVREVIEGDRTQTSSALIVSSDHDFKKLLIEGRVWMAKDFNPKAPAYSEKDFVEEMGCTPDCYLMLCAVTGDASDNVPGVPGIGPKKALKALTAADWNIFKLFEDPKFEPHRETILSNLTVLSFKFPHGQPWVLYGERRTSTLEQIYRKWEFESLLNRLKEEQVAS